MTKRVIISTLFLLALLFAVFVWPTRYAYYSTSQGMLMRHDRITGEMRVWSIKYGWVKAGQLP